VVDECAWHFYPVLGVGRCQKHARGPPAAAHQGQGITDRRRRLGVPCRWVRGSCGRGGSPVRMRQERHHREEAEESGRRPQDRPFGPLALRLDAEVGPHLVEGHFALPAQDEDGTLDWLRRALELDETCKQLGRWEAPEADQAPQGLCRNCQVRFSCPSVRTPSLWDADAVPADDLESYEF
jgi:hypothetical protein